MLSIVPQQSVVHLRHHELELPRFLELLLVLGQNGRLLVHFQVVIVELGQGVALVSGLRSYVFVYTGCHAALRLEAASVYWLFRFCSRGDSEFEGGAEQCLCVEFAGSLALLNSVFDFAAPSEHALLVLLKNLIALILQLLDSLQLRFLQALFRCPFLLQPLQPANLHLMKIVLLAEYLKLPLHLHNQLILQLPQFALKLASFLLMPATEGIALLFCMFLHQTVHSVLLAYLQFAQLLTEIQCLVHSLLQRHQFLLELQLLQSILGLDLEILARLAQSSLQLLRFIERLLFKGLSPLNHSLLQLLKLIIEPLTKLIDPILSLIPILADLSFVNFLPQMVLPLGNVALQFPHFLHQGFELDVKLDLEAVIRYEFQSLLDEGKDADLLIRVQCAVFILIEDAHEIFNRADLGEIMEVCLVLLEDHLQHLFCQVGTSYVILGQRCPNC